jgi:hypothetical protein
VKQRDPVEIAGHRVEVTAAVRPVMPYVSITNDRPSGNLRAQVATDLSGLREQGWVVIHTFRSDEWVVAHPAWADIEAERVKESQRITAR